MIENIDTGFIGSILDSWIKPAHVEKSFTLSHVLLREKSTALKNVFTNIEKDQVGLFTSWLRKILLLLKRVKSLGIQVYERRKLLSGKGTVSVMMVFTTGWRDNLVNLVNVKYAEQLNQNVFNGQTKIISGKEDYQTINACALGAI